VSYRPTDVTNTLHIQHTHIIHCNSTQTTQISQRKSHNLNTSLTAEVPMPSQSSFFVGFMVNEVALGHVFPRGTAGFLLRVSTFHQRFTHFIHLPLTLCNVSN